jgi:hypothetical protein
MPFFQSFLQQIIILLIGTQKVDRCGQGTVPTMVQYLQYRTYYRAFART